MTYSSLASRLCGRHFFALFQKKQAALWVIFKNGGSPPLRFSRIGGLPLYTTQLSSDIMISKGGEYKPINSAFKKERNAYETQKP